MPRRPLPTAGPTSSPYAAFKARWAGGCGSDLCDLAKRKCYARGTLPCQVLLVGEAPGESEDVLGKPFVGPAGKLLDAVLARAVPPDVAYALTNLTLCIPRDGLGAKATEPDPESIQLCKPRLEEFIRLADGPEESLRLIVCVGSYAREHFKPGYKHSVRPHRPIRIVDILHPAYILRSSIAQRGLLIQRTVATLATAIDDHVRGEGRDAQT